MDILSERTRYLKEIDGFLVNCNSTLRNLMTSIDWTDDNLKRTVEDFDDLNEDLSEHVAIEDSAQISDSIKEEEPLAGPSNASKELDEFIANLTFAKQNQKKNETEALVDLLESERNTKRRRVSYKNKVHTKNKSHTEVLRELVREQMEVLTEYADLSAPTIKKEVQTKQEDGLIQLGYARGNPYLKWQKVGYILENRNEEKTNFKDRYNGRRNWSSEQDNKGKDRSIKSSSWKDEGRHRNSTRDPRNDYSSKTNKSSRKRSPHSRHDDPFNVRNEEVRSKYELKGSSRASRDSSHEKTRRDRSKKHQEHDKLPSVPEEMSGDESEKSVDEKIHRRKSKHKKSKSKRSSSKHRKHKKHRRERSSS